jgi:Cof subfamily protein (haloacid dehalogenase superfamily)
MKYYFTDLDDTIVRKDGTISNQTVQAFKKLESMGNRVVICTGRPIIGIKKVIRRLELKKDTPIIALNGCAVYNSNSDKIFDFGLTPQDFRLAINACDELKLDYGLYDENYVYVTDLSNKYGNVEVEICENRVKHIDDFTAESSPKILCFVDPDNTSKVIEKLNAKTKNMFYITTSKPFFIEITPKGINKGEAIKTMLSNEGVSLDNTICFGDGDNDLTMFEVCKKSVAVENCSPAIRKIATDITLSCEEDGVAKYIYEKEL